MILPNLASARGPVIDRSPILIERQTMADAQVLVEVVRQPLAVQQQQLPLLNIIQALEQSRFSTADAAVAYAVLQGIVHTQARPASVSSFGL